MKAGFYPSLAVNGIKKNRKFYLPYIHTCTGMTTMFYVISYLCGSDVIARLPGAGTISSFLEMGSGIIAFFSLVFLFYTNSFLTKRRRKEFGLYNILGMNKWNIGRLLICETVIIAIISIICGLVLGIAVSKLAELILVNLLKGDIVYTFSVSGIAILKTIEVFSLIFLLLLLNSIAHLRLSRPVDLLKSENVGEKPPKSNWIFGLLGVIILSAAYYLAVSIKEPIEALVWFFIAVIMVIAATYMIFISGSVIFCRILQKNKGYYYKKNHFVSVSSMVYRMKRNGAGLASICILATMVLVMLSSTTCLYFGVEDSIDTRYPNDININTSLSETKSLFDQSTDKIKSEINRVCTRNNTGKINEFEYSYAILTGITKESYIETDPVKIEEMGMNSALFQISLVYFIPLENYNELSGEQCNLKENEALIYSLRSEYPYSKIEFAHGKSYEIVKHLDEFPVDGYAAMNVMPALFVVVPDLSEATNDLSALADSKGESAVSFRWNYGMDTNLSKAEQIELKEQIANAIYDMAERDENGIFSYYIESKAENRDDFYSTFGGLLFLGIILSAVFIFAAVLIIYYKQISEGYEDESRFDIMQKIGMTKREIRQSINSQLLTVFFLPLIGAGLHLAFAFPMVRKLLLMFNLNNVTLFVFTVIISFAVFALFYIIVYRITSNSYYSIVTGKKRN